MLLLCDRDTTPQNIPCEKEEEGEMRRRRRRRRRRRKTACGGFECFRYYQMRSYYFTVRKLSLNYRKLARRDERTMSFSPNPSDGPAAA